MKRFSVAVLLGCLILSISLSAYAECGYKWTYTVAGSYGGAATTHTATCKLNSHETEYVQSTNGKHIVQIQK